MLTRRRFLTLTSVTPALVSVAGSAGANTPIYVAGGVAVDGTDVVAYFT